MHTIKLAVALGVMSMAGQTLAHKAWHGPASAVPAPGLTAAQTDTNPAALLDVKGDRDMTVPNLLPATTSQKPAPNTSLPVVRINRRH